MNNICGVCGGFVGSFMYSGQGAKICPGTHPHLDSVWQSSNCFHCYCIKEQELGASTTSGVPHVRCCNCGNRQMTHNGSGTVTVGTTPHSGIANN